jgi:hypothetical protein
VAKRALTGARKGLFAKSLFRREMSCASFLSPWLLLLLARLRHADRF